jgi:hypothetical protein
MQPMQLSSRAEMILSDFTATHAQNMAMDVKLPNE